MDSLSCPIPICAVAWHCQAWVRRQRERV